MDWSLIIFMLVAGGGLWWAGFYATKRMRIGKNLEREEAAKRAREAAALSAAEAVDASVEGAVEETREQA